MRIFDLSLRHKIPLWGSLLIVVSTLATSAVLLARSYADLKQDLFTSSGALGQTLANTLFPALLHDDLWRAFEIINAPMQTQASNNPLESEAILVVGADGLILAATDPKRMPTLAPLAEVSIEHRRLADAMKERALLSGPRVFELDGAQHFYVATPIAEESRQVGVLVISHDRAKLWARFAIAGGENHAGCGSGKQRTA